MTVTMDALFFVIVEYITSSTTKKNWENHKPWSWLTGLPDHLKIDTLKAGCVWSSVLDTRLANNKT